jgi:hypothetical protein
MSAINEVDLNINTNAIFAAAAEEEIAIRHGDLSQLGLERGKLRPDLHIPLVNGARLDFPNSAGSKFWSSFIVMPGNVDPHATVRLTIDTQPLGRMNIGSSDADDKRIISELQESLDPKVLISHHEIMRTDRMKDAISIQRQKAEASYGMLAAHMNAKLEANEKLSSYLIREEIIADEGTTDRPGLVVDSDHLKTVSQAQFFAIVSLLDELTPELSNSVENINFILAYGANPELESIGDHPVIASQYATARAESMARSFKPPREIKALFEVPSHAIQIKVVPSVEMIEKRVRKIKKENVESEEVQDEKVWAPLAIKSGKEALTSELAFYFLSFKQITPNTVDRAREFAFARLLVVRHGLHIDSKEMTAMLIGEPLICDIAECKYFVEQLRSPEKGYACLYASVISFMKSGHHATAHNLPNTLQKVLGAIGITVQLDVVRNMIPTAVYHGPHVASMRLLHAYLMYKNKVDKVTNAIAYRLHPNPPGAAAYCNLELFIDSLNNARFFEVLGKEQEYRTFKEAMKQIKDSMWYVAPYSYYLFGKSSPDPLALKAEAAKLASYAAALSVALPNSSLIPSPALKKLAESEAKNSISAQLYVQAYASGFARFFRHTIEGSIAKKFGVPRGQITL